MTSVVEEVEEPDWYYSEDEDLDNNNHAAHQVSTDRFFCTYKATLKVPRGQLL